MCSSSSYPIVIAVRNVTVITVTRHTLYFDSTKLFKVTRATQFGWGSWINILFFTFVFVDKDVVEPLSSPFMQIAEFRKELEVLFPL